MIFGSDHAANGYVKAMLRTQLIHLLKEGGVKQVFGRPATKRGWQLLEEYGFDALSDPNDIWATDGNSLLQLLEAEDPLLGALSS
jgi:hypothetical protein